MNINPQIVDAQGREQFHMGGQTAWKTSSFKGYCVSLEWFEGNKSSEPMLCIWPEAKSKDAGAFGICLSSIGAYADPSGRPAPGSLIRCYDALPALGKESNQREAHTLLDVVLRYTPDLIGMPPAPLAIRRAERGEAVLEVELVDRNTGKTQQEVSI